MRRAVCFVCVLLLLFTVFLLPSLLSVRAAEHFGLEVFSCPQHATITVCIEVPHTLLDGARAFKEATLAAIPPFLTAPLRALGSAVWELTGLLADTLRAELSGCALQ